MIKINRVSKGAKQTIGVMLIDDEPLFWTLEEPWQNNLKSISCIPTGHYRVKSYYSPKFGKCYRVTDLADREPANREGILIHTGNTTDDISGCILLGLELGQLSGKKAVLKSKEAYQQFLSKMHGVESCDLIIY